MMEMLTGPWPSYHSRTITQEFGIVHTHRSFKGMLDIFKDFLYYHALDQGKTVVLCEGEHDCPCGSP